MHDRCESLRQSRLVFIEYQKHGSLQFHPPPYHSQGINFHHHQQPSNGPWDESVMRKFKRLLFRRDKLWMHFFYFALLPMLLPKISPQNYRIFNRRTKAPVKILTHSFKHKTVIPGFEGAKIMNEIKHKNNDTLQIAQKREVAKRKRTNWNNRWNKWNAVERNHPSGTDAMHLMHVIYPNRCNFYFWKTHPLEKEFYHLYQPFFTIFPSLIVVNHRLINIISTQGWYSFYYQDER